MQTREKPCVYVIASEQAFNSLVIPRVYSEEMTFIRVNEPKIGSFNTITLDNLDRANKNYLIILDQKYLQCEPAQFLNFETYRVKNPIFDAAETLASIYQDVVSINSEKRQQGIAEFMRKHNAIKASKAWIPTFFKSTNLSTDPDIVNILTDALHKKSSDANKVAIEMEWLTKTGDLHPNAPSFVAKAYPVAKASLEPWNSIASPKPVRPLY